MNKAAHSRYNTNSPQVYKHESAYTTNNIFVQGKITLKDECEVLPHEQLAQKYV